MTVAKQRTIRVGIDGGDYYPGEKPLGGIARLVGSFLGTISGIADMSVKFRYYFFGSNVAKVNIDNVVVNNLPKRFFSSIFLPFRLIFDRSDLYLGFSGIIPPIIRFFKIKCITFIHDFGFYDHPNYYHDPKKMQWQTEYAIYGSEKIIVFSEYIKQQLLKRFLRVSPEKVVCIYPGVDHIVANKNLRKINGSYFLYVGVIKPGKKIVELLDIFSQYLKQPKSKKERLYLIGAKEPEYYKSILKNLVYLKIQKYITFLEDVTEQDLISYYVGCRALLNTSHEEGFCYPVIEALSLGKKVIVNDIPLYKEFIPYFKSLYITKDKKSFINEMLTDGSISKNPGKHPFHWQMFTEGVLQTIKKTV